MGPGLREVQTVDGQTDHPLGVMGRCSVCAAERGLGYKRPEPGRRQGCAWKRRGWQGDLGRALPCLPQVSAAFALSFAPPTSPPGRFWSISAS